jgi:hypothetical protein
MVLLIVINGSAFDGPGPRRVRLIVALLDAWSGQPLKELVFRNQVSGQEQPRKHTRQNAPEQTPAPSSGRIALARGMGRVAIREVEPGAATAAEPMTVSKWSTAVGTEHGQWQPVGDPVTGLSEAGRSCATPVIQIRSH